MALTLKRYILGALILSSCLVVGVKAQSIAEFTVGPAPARLTDWPVEMTISLDELTGNSSAPVDESRLVLVEVLATSKFTDPRPFQISSNIAPWRSDSKLRTLSWQLQGETPKGAVRTFELRTSSGSPRPQASQLAGVGLSQTPQLTTVSNRYFTITHDPAKGFGIAKLRYHHNGGEMALLMADELYTPEVPGPKEAARMWNGDSKPEVRIVEQGPLRSILEAKVHFTGLKTRPPEAIYRYTYWKDSPLIGLQIWFPRQKLAVKEFASVSLARFSFTDQSTFTHVAAGDPFIEKDFTVDPFGIPLCSRNVNRIWGSLTKGDIACGLIGANLGNIYGATNGHTLAGPVHSSWRGQEVHWQGHLYVGSAGPDGHAVRHHADLLAAIQPKLSLPGFNARCEKLHAALHARRSGVMAGSVEAVAIDVAGSLADLAVEDLGIGSVKRGVVLLAEAERLASASKKEAGARLPLLLRFGDGLVVANRQMGLFFWKSSAGYSLCGLKNIALGHQFLRPSAELAGLWELQMRTPDRQVEHMVSPADAQACRLATRRAGNGVTLTMDWDDCRSKTAEASVNVTATVSLKADSPLSRWRINVRPSPGSLGLWRVDFPIIPGISKPGRTNEPEAEEYLAAAMKQGILLPSPSRGIRLGGEKYPGQTMFQLLDYWYGRNNLYLAAHDPKAGTKDFWAETDVPGSFAMGIRHDPPHMAVPGKPFATDYDCVVGTFEGDWYDACKVYREWGTKQVWCSKGTIDKRKDIPAWLKTNCLTLRPGDKAPKGTDVLIKARERLPDTPMIAIWYDYVASTNMFDFCPEMKPAVPEFTPAVKAGMERNIPSLAFMHAFLWGGMDPDFQRVAVPNAIVKEDGQPMVDKYMQRDVAYMDPWSEAWQRRLAQVLVGLVKDHGVKGAYMDLLGCGPFNNFREPNGKHPSGGDYWASGHRALMKYLRDRVRRVEPEFVMLAENPTEPYLDLMDAGTMFGGVNDDLTPLNIPMLQTIYGDYLIQYGPKSAGVANPPREVLLPIQTFMYGCQLGRIFVWDETSWDGQLFPKLAQYRQATLPYFVGAEVLRPLPIKYLTESGTDLQKMDLAILRTVRRAPDGSVALMFGNTTFGKKMQFRFTIDPRQLGFDDNSKLTIERVTPKSRTPIGTFSGKQERTEELEPMNLLVLVVKNEKDRLR